VPNGLLVLDLWVRPAALTERPQARIKQHDYVGHNLIRIAEPEHQVRTASMAEFVEAGEWLTGKRLHKHCWSAYVAPRVCG
jgi:hypothetical protein